MQFDKFDSKDGTPQSNNNAPVSSLDRTGSPKRNLTFSANGDRVFAVDNGVDSSNGTDTRLFNVTDYSATSGTQIGSYKRLTGMAINGVVRRQGDVAYIRLRGNSLNGDGTGLGTLRCINVSTGATVWSVPIFNPNFQNSSIAISPQGDKIALYYLAQPGKLLVYDALTGALIKLVDLDLGFGASSPPFVWFSPNGNNNECGSKKDTDRNWEKGIPVHCFIDSAVRHYLKWRRGDTDEPHDRAFIWNILGATYTTEKFLSS